MSAPAVNPIAERIYEEVLPITHEDESNGWALRHFINAWTESMVLIDSYVRDTDAGPGYSSVMEPETAPALFLDWLAQFVGKSFDGPVEDTVKRLQIRSMAGLRRGSIPAMVAAIRATLTDPVNGAVYLFERVGGDAYALSIATNTAQTPDPVATRAAAISQKPAGLVLNYSTVSGGDFNTLFATHSSFDDVYNTFVDFNEVMTNPEKQ